MDLMACQLFIQGRRTPEAIDAVLKSALGPVALVAVSWPASTSRQPTPGHSCTSSCRSHASCHAGVTRLCLVNGFICHLPFTHVALGTRLRCLTQAFERPSQKGLPLALTRGEAILPLAGVRGAIRVHPHTEAIGDGPLDLRVAIEAAPVPHHRSL